MITASESLNNDNLTGCSQSVPSSAISEHSLIQDVVSYTEALRTLSARGFHANPLVSQVREKRNTMIEICGPKQLRLFGESDPQSSFLKMFPVFSATSTPLPYSDNCLKTDTRLYPRLSLGLMTLAPLTKGNGCGLWPTVRTSDAKGGQRPNDGKARIGSNGERWGLNLADAVKPPTVWPTPTKTDSIKGGNVSERPGAMGLSETTGGQLNPDWVAWLMGWPIGWESLEPIEELKWLDWSVDPADNGEIPRVATGTKDRVSRLEALGNGQVPLCAATAWRILTQ